jgi:hypothetical protein
MTEAELTEMAILKSKNDSIALERRKKEEAEKAKAAKATKEVSKSQPESPESPESPKTETSEAPETLSKDPETGEDLTQYKYSVELGNDKVIHYKNWTGRTKKLLKKELKDLQREEDVDIDSILETLVRDYIIEREIYLSPVEIQYLIVKIREVSVGDTYSFYSTCPTCKLSQEITAKTSDIYRYTKGKYPYQSGEYEFVDIPLQSDLDTLYKTMIDSETYDGITTKTDLEIAMHIKNGNLSPFEILDIIDEMGLIELKTIMKTLSDVAPKMEMSIDEKCDNEECPDYRKTVTFKADEIPDIFDDLL